jgi:hypothetical protein
VRGGWAVSGTGFAAPAIFLVAGSAVILALIAIGGAQAFTSARRAKDHLTSAIALAPARAQPAVATAALDAHSARTAGANSDDEGASQQTFAQLTQYYAANISQGQAIFWASFTSMAVGFAIIFAGIVNAGVNSTTAIVAGVAGVLSQFIAATFLVALRSTQAQSTAFAQSLVELRLRDVRAAADARAVTLGLRLLDEISGDGDEALANQTRAALAMGLIVREPAPAAAVVPTAVAPPERDETSRATFRTARSRAEAVKFE